jgi:hypothetical protein
MCAGVKKTCDVAGNCPERLKKRTCEDYNTIIERRITARVKLQEMIRLIQLLEFLNQP